MKKNKYYLIILILFFNIACKKKLVNEVTLPVTNKKIYVLEKDELFGGWSSVDNFHMTIVFNQEKTPVTAEIESQFHENLNIQTKL